MKKVMNTNIEITVVADTYYRFPIDQLDTVLRNFGGTDAAIYINRILLPSSEEDETFFYASVEAAKEGKVWVEEAHGFFSRDWKCQFEAGCFDMDDEDDFWEETLNRIREDIFGYTPVTGEEGQAIVRDQYLSDICKERGYEVLPCGDQTFNEDGSPNEWWIIFPQGGEEEYFRKVYSEKEPTIEERLATIVVGDTDLLTYLKNQLRSCEEITHFEIERFNEDGSIDAWVGWIDTFGNHHGEEVNIHPDSIVNGLELGLVTHPEELTTEEKLATIIVNGINFLGYLKHHLDAKEIFDLKIIEAVEGGDEYTPCLIEVTYLSQDEAAETVRLSISTRDVADNVSLTVYSEIDDLIYKDEGTKEWCYESDTLNAYWNEYSEEGSFHFGGWYTRGYKIPYAQWKAILEDMVKNLDDYALTKSVEPYHTEGEFLRHRLDHMPFDRYEDGKGFIHATGWEYLEVNGDWVTEYEDDLELEE